MAAVSDAKRFLYLSTEGQTIKLADDDPVHLLENVVKGVEDLRDYLKRLHTKNKLPKDVYDVAMSFIE